MDDYLRGCGKKGLSDTANFCLDFCNKVDVESRMLTMLEEYQEYIPAIEYYSRNEYPYFLEGDRT